MLVRYLKNSASVLVSQLLLLFSSLGVYVIVGRQLGPGELGKLSFVLGYIGLYSFLPDLGVNLYLIREIARKKESVQEALGIAFTVIMLMLPVTTISIVVISHFLNVPTVELESIYIGIGYIIMGALISIFRAAFHAYEHMEYETYSISLERFITFVGCVVVLLAHGGLLSLVAMHLFSRVCAFVMSGWIYVKKIAQVPHLSLDVKPVIEVIKGALPFALNVLTTTIYVQADLVMLNLWMGNTVSGYYKAATSLIIPIAVIATAVNTALFPRMAQAFTTSIERVKFLAEGSIRYLFMIGWPIGIGILLIAPQVILLLYGSEFQESILPLRILALLVPMRFVNNTLGNTLTASNRQGVRAIIILSSSILNVVLNLFVIPRWSYIGTSITTMITEVFILIVLYTSIWYSEIRISLWGLINRSLFSGLIMYACDVLLGNRNLILIIGISIVVYGTCLWVFQAFPQADIDRVKYVLHQRVNSIWTER